MSLLPIERSLAAQAGDLDQDWCTLVRSYLDSPMGRSLVTALEGCAQAGKAVFPRDVFRALRLTALGDVRVVILGQDPYHGAGQANGLAFSVDAGIKIPPSLRNIFKEQQRDLGLPPPVHGDLAPWARQGVLLLNTTLTVEEGRAASHAGWGWSVLTDAIIDAVARDPQPKVFMLWGAHAQAKRPVIEDAAQRMGRADHLLLTANHPSPLSANRPPLPFVGCGHFARAATFGREHGWNIDWRLV